jgi:hypothetical protein
LEVKSQNVFELRSACQTRRSAASDAGLGSIRRGFSVWWLTLSDDLLRKRR